jgi:hypothetical protein
MTDQEKVELLATKVMEWRQVNLGLSIIWVDADGRDVSALVDSWDPLQNDADAIMIVNKLRADKAHVEMVTWPKEWACHIAKDGHGVTGSGDELRDAIVSAAVQIARKLGGDPCEKR